MDILKIWGTMLSLNSGWVRTASFRYLAPGQGTSSRARWEGRIVLEVGRRKKKKQKFLSEDMGCLCCRNRAEEVRTRASSWLSFDKAALHPATPPYTCVPGESPQPVQLELSATD